VRVLLDESLPRPLGELLPGHDTNTVAGMKWTSLGNGALLREAAMAFDVLLTADQVRELGVLHPEDHAGKLLARRGAGCAKCRYTGYYGRTGIFEVLTVNARLRHLVARAASPEELRRTARQDGLRFLREHAVRKVAAGITAFEEASRATADAEVSP